MDKKPLYLCKSLIELQQKSEMNKCELGNVKKSCEIMEKLYEKYESSLLDKDEELSYIYVMRFLTLYSQIKKSFKNDINYINAHVSNQKIEESFNKADMLKLCLKERYKSLNPKVEEIPKESAKIEIKTPKGYITVEELYKNLRKKENILVVDVRPSDEYFNCHMTCTQLINIPANELKAGCSIVDVNKLLESRNNLREFDIWNNRIMVSQVILVGWNEEDSDNINLVKDAIFKWDAENSIKDLVILDHGLHSFLNHYPTMVTNSKYKGPVDTNQKDFIQPDKIQYPDWKANEVEKKRKIEIKKQDEKKDLENQNENDLENRFNQIRSNSSKPPISRSLKHSINNADLNLETKANLVVDRSLKPAKPRDQIQDDIFTSIKENGTNSPNPTNKTMNFPETDVLNNEKPKMSPDRSLKPKVLREVNRDPLPVDTPKTLESVDVTSDINTPSEIPRLSNNSRTNQDRTNFTAKGGAKSIPPPTDVIEDKKAGLPPWISYMLDRATNEYFYLDKRDNKKYRYLPDEIVEISTENSTQHDHVETLKDHSLINKQYSKPISGTSLKRSTSQPNLSEDLIVPQKPQISTDSTIATNSSKQQDLPILNRQAKPNYIKTFTEFSASRLNNFNPTYRTVIPGLTGLRNMGNTCYMNSVVQALSNTKFLTNYILTNNYHHDIIRDNPLGYGGEIVMEFACLITALWSGKYREVSPSDFKRMIDTKNEMFRGSEQHDSQEFLLFLLDGLHEDLNHGSKHSKVTAAVNDDQLNDIDRALHSWKAHIAINDSVIVRIFQGQYRSKVTCDYCQMSSVTFDAFMYLSLPLVANHNRCTLEDCLKLFLAEEKMTGASQWFCPKCKTNRNAKKKIDIWKLPPYLLIHLKRFSCTGQYRQKLNTFVDFPMESFSLVDILKHTKQSQKHDTYHLYAVSNHHGNMESGHYTSFCKNMKENEWYNYDDDVVSKIRESDVKTPSAYILFYESYNLKHAGFKN